MFRTSPDGIYLLTAAGDVLCASGPGAYLLGYQPEGSERPFGAGLDSLGRSRSVATCSSHGTRRTRCLRANSGTRPLERLDSVISRARSPTSSRQSACMPSLVTCWHAAPDRLDGSTSNGGFCECRCA